MKQILSITYLLLVALLLNVVSSFSPTGLQSKHIICPSSVSSAFSSTSSVSQCSSNSIIDDISKSTSRLYMSDGEAAAALPEKKGFLDKLKAKIPPANERKKLVPLALMFFFILFNYTILRDTKDVLMVTAKGSGAEVIPFIKTYVNLPTAIGFTALYSKLCDKMDQKDVFYTCTIPFLIFFAAFAFVVYPNVGVLHPHAFVDMIAAKLPEGFGAPLAIVRNWSFAVFYVMAEMWGSVVASLLFWSFANEVTTVEEAKKYCEFLYCLYCKCILQSSALLTHHHII